MPPGQTGDDTRAESIGDPGSHSHVRVAGSNESDGRVYVWERNGTGIWSAPNICVVDANEEAVLCGQTLVFEFVHDMNNNGHIVCHASDTQGDAHVVILGCVADINQDMRVNGTDRDILRDDYGACANCNSCPSDLDCDCDVDATDLAQLLATWSATGPCRIPNFCGDPEGGEGLTGGEPLEGLFNIALEITGFSGPDDFLEWTEDVDASQADNVSEFIHLLMME